MNVGRKLSFGLKQLGGLRVHFTYLVAQMVKHLPAMQETRLRFLGREDPLEKEMATHSSILACLLWTEEAGMLSPWGHKE